MKINEILHTKSQIPVILAPMAGVTDLPYREICMLHGCDFTYSEMVSAKAISYNNKKTYKLMQYSEATVPFGIQIFGHEPQTMADMAMRICDLYGNNIALIDINMGCPAPKIVNNGDGSALMKDPILAGRIIEKVAQKSTVPITVKFRKGFDEEHINAVEFAKTAQESGAMAITVHGRTRSQMYSGFCDLDIIAQVKSSVKIPVIGNGDITDAQAAAAMLSYTHCDGLMIGRAAQGNPFIFESIKNVLSGSKAPSATVKERIDAARLHIELHEKYKSEKTFNEMRKHIAWYTKGIHGSSKLRSEIFSCNSPKDALAILQKIEEQND